MPSPAVVDTATVVRLPWLAPFDVEMEKLGFEGVHAKIKVDAGTNVFVDTAARRARIIDPDGRIRSWDGNAKLTADPDDQSWMIVWHVVGGTDPQIQLTPMTDGCDDEVIQASGYEFYCDGLEGSEHLRFPQMVQLLKDPFFNPLGFPLKSGLYKQEMISECFHLDFGDDGATPSLTIADETAPAPLDFPYRTEIDVKEPITLENAEIPPGYYRTEVRVFHVTTGEARSIEIKHLSNRYHIDGDVMVDLIHQGKIEILNILEDQRPNF